jgi:hypothetical protein
MRGLGGVVYRCSLTGESQVQPAELAERGRAYDSAQRRETPGEGAWKCVLTGPNDKWLGVDEEVRRETAYVTET